MPFPRLRETALLGCHFLSAFFGTMVTLQVCRAGVHPVAASALVSLGFASLTLVSRDPHRLSLAAFCGTFAGMTGLNWLTGNGGHPPFDGHFNLIASGISLLTGAIYVLVELLTLRHPRHFFAGYGGRLGVVSFFSVLLFLGIRLFQNHGFHNGPAQASSVFFKWEPSEFLAMPAAFLSCGVFLFLWGKISRPNGNFKVLTAAVIALAGDFILRQTLPQGIFLGQAWYSGIFVGMSTHPSDTHKKDCLLAATLTGLLLLLCKNLLVGIGGKLGLLSFLAILAIRAASKLSSKPRKISSI